jgi:hypothetical protein
MKHDSIVYRVDAGDTLTFVNDAWDRFAAENDAPDVAGGAVRGRPLWDFVSDPTTRQLYRILLARARSGHLVRFAFRCDGPRRRRRMEMTMAPAGKGEVEFTSRVLADRARAEMPLLRRDAQRHEELITTCGWCKRIRVEARWVEVEEAVAAWGLFEQPVRPMLTHGICETCLHEMTALAVEMSV